MAAPQHILPSKDKDAAAVLVEFLKPGAWIPPAHARWLPVIEALLETFLRHFDRARAGPASGSPARPSAIRISRCAHGANGGSRRTHRGASSEL